MTRHARSTAHPSSSPPALHASKPRRRQSRRIPSSSGRYRNREKKFEQKEAKSAKEKTPISLCCLCYLLFKISGVRSEQNIPCLAQRLYPAHFNPADVR